MSDYRDDQDDYASLADEMNDPDVGPWVEGHWDPEAVAGAKRHAEREGLRWPPGVGDYDRLYEREH